MAIRYSDAVRRDAVRLLREEREVLKRPPSTDRQGMFPCLRVSDVRT